MVHPPSCFPKKLLVVQIIKRKFREHIIMINTHKRDLIILKIVKINTINISDIYLYGFNVLYFVNFSCLDFYCMNAFFFCAPYCNFSLDLFFSGVRDFYFPY